ncbi:MAG: SpoIIE family protein phosphatase [Bacteroidales bacterium]
MASRKTTIFRQLILNIAIPTLLALLVFAVLNFQHTSALVKKGIDDKNTMLANEVTKVLRFQDIAVNIIDIEFTNKFREMSSKLINGYFANTENISKMDLRAIANKIGMDPQNDDIYVISANGTIVNTTFREDMGLNLFTYGGVFKRYLQNILDSGKFKSDLFAIEAKTKRPKKYSYQPTLDGKYIIELGAYSKKVEEIIQAIEDVKSELKSETEGIIDVELYFMADGPFSMNKDALFVESQEKNLLNAFLKKDTTSFTEKVGRSWYQYQYIYQERANLSEKPMSSLYKGSVIRIISDRTSQKMLFKTEVIRFSAVFLITMIIVSILMYRKTKVITNPIKNLVDNVDRITNGNLRERAEVTGNNEITRLSEKFNMMIAQLESYYYELEEKVKERTLRIEKQKEEIESQRDALAEKNTMLNEAYTEIEEQKKHIMDSIYYARRIQTAILPSFTLLEKYFKNYFIFYMPKDIVSGDFYWMSVNSGLVMIAAVDCTGHGVPGAFMSIVGFNQLNNAVNVQKARKASDILNELNKGVIQTLNENTSETSIKDGMDMTLCVFDFKNKKVDFAGANNPIIHIRDNNMAKIKGDRFPIGAFVDGQEQLFANNEIKLVDGDMIYMFSDGYADQFGGPENKKFFTKRFEQLLFDIHNEPLEQQKEILKTTLYDYMGNNDQVDDILVIGIKV